MEWYRRDKEAVAAALRRGERPDLATTMASGPLDELVALHEELGIFAVLDEVEPQRVRAGVPDELLLRTLATLPFVDQASLSGAAEVLFREPAVLLHLGWAPLQIRSGSNGRHRHPDGRQEESLPCHPDTLRDALRRVGESAWQKAQQAGVQSLYQRQLVHGKVYAVDGSGLGDELRVVALVCVSATRPIIVAWRVLSGAASEKGKEAKVTRTLIEQVLQVAGPNAISLLLADALYADGPLLAWLKYCKGIEGLVRLPEDRLLYQDVQGLADAHLIEWTHHRYVRTVQGHKHIREVEVTAAGELTSWQSFLEAAATYEVTDASLWACLIRDVTTSETAQEPPIALVSTRSWQNGFAALQAYRPRCNRDGLFRCRWRGGIVWPQAHARAGCRHRPARAGTGAQRRHRWLLQFTGGTTDPFLPSPVHCSYGGTERSSPADAGRDAAFCASIGNRFTYTGW